MSRLLVYTTVFLFGICVYSQQACKDIFASVARSKPKIRLSGKLNRLIQDGTYVVELFGKEMQIFMGARSHAELREFFGDSYGAFIETDVNTKGVIGIDIHTPRKIQGAVLVHENHHRRWNNFLRNNRAMLNSQRSFLVDKSMLKVSLLIDEFMAFYTQARYFPKPVEPANVLQVIDYVKELYPQGSKATRQFYMLFYISSIRYDKSINELLVTDLIHTAMTTTARDFKSIQRTKEWRLFRSNLNQGLQASKTYDFFWD